jgi:uncharacterized RmlC-like cupin family protein
MFGSSPLVIFPSIDVITESVIFIAGIIVYEAESVIIRIRMPTLKKTILPYTQERPEQRISFLDIDHLKKFVPIEKIKAQQIISFLPQGKGGNHKHPRTEYFIGLGKGLQLTWMDESGQKQTEQMNPKNQLILFEVPPFLPHVVINTSETEIAFLLEFADQEINETERVEIE